MVEVGDGASSGVGGDGGARWRGGAIGMGDYEVERKISTPLGVKEKQAQRNNKHKLSHEQRTK